MEALRVRAGTRSAGRGGPRPAAASRARSRWRCSRRRGARPASCSGWRCAPPRGPCRSSPSATRRRGPACGDSLLRPNMTCRRSACSVLVGRPVEGPPRWMSKTMSGSSIITARFMASDLRAMPGPEEAVTPSAPPKEAPIAAQMAAISSSAWKVDDAVVLEVRQLVEHVRGRGDRVGAEEERQSAAPAGRDQAEGQGRVAHDVAVAARAPGPRPAPRSGCGRPR